MARHAENFMKVNPRFMIHLHVHVDLLSNEHDIYLYVCFSKTKGIYTCRFNYLFVTFVRPMFYMSTVCSDNIKTSWCSNASGGRVFSHMTLRIKWNLSYFLFYNATGPCSDITTSWCSNASSGRIFFNMMIRVK